MVKRPLARAIQDLTSLFERCAERLSCSWQYRHLLFMIATLLAVLVTGYHLGTYDHVIHIPFLKKSADPTLFPNDAFFEMRFQHYSYFWFMWIPLYRLGILEIGMFVAHLIVTYLTFWAIWTLSETLFRDPGVSLLGTVFFVIPHMGFGAFPVLEFSLLNRTFVLPFLLWSVVLYLRQRGVLACFCLGLLYNLHVVSVNFVLVMVLFDSVLRFRIIGWRSLFLRVLSFVTGALPVLIWKAKGPPVALEPNAEWLSIVSGVLYHLYYPLSPQVHILLPTLSGVSALLLFVVARQDHPSPDHDRTMDHFVCAIVIVLVVQVLMNQVYPMTILNQLQIVRIGKFGLIFGYLYFARYLVVRYRARALSPFSFFLLGCATITQFFPLFLLILWGWDRLARRWVRWQQVGAGLLMTLAVMGGLVIVMHYGIWGPGIYLGGPRNEWYDVQIWAREHTPKDALFITPPYMMNVYESEWRVFAERSTLVTLSDLMEVALVPDYADIWKERFEAIAPGARARFGGNYFENREITVQAFYSLSSADMRRVADIYQVAYLVVEKPHAYEFPVVYENEGFVVYELARPRAAD